MTESTWEGLTDAEVHGHKGFTFEEKLNGICNSRELELEAKQKIIDSADMLKERQKEQANLSKKARKD